MLPSAEPIPRQPRFFLSIFCRPKISRRAFGTICVKRGGRKERERERGSGLAGSPSMPSSGCHHGYKDHRLCTECHAPGTTLSAFCTCPATSKRSVSGYKQKRHCAKHGGSALCQHSRSRWQCRECKPAGSNVFCQHNKMRKDCLECAPPDTFCPHGKRRSKCSVCQ